MGMPEQERIDALVRAAQRGDEDHLAQDVAQEAFVDAFRLLAALREPAAFGAWLRTIVFKHCDRLRRRARVQTMPLDGQDVASNTLSPADALERAERRRQVRQAIARLSLEHRLVVLLYYMGEHSQSAIADFLSLTPNIVKTRLYAARQRLKDHMSDIEKDLRAARPSNDTRFADAIKRLIRPEALKRREPLFWHPAIAGTELWDLFVASVTGDLATATELLDRNPALARGEYVGRSALSFAVRYNQPRIAEVLLEHGANPVMSGTDDPLPRMAADRGYMELADVLERAIAARHGPPEGGPHFSARGRGNEICAAIKQRDAGAVRGLLDASPDLVHARDMRTNQPLHCAVMTRQIDLVDELLSRGADIDARRGDGAQPIHLTNGDYEYRGWRDVPGDVTTTPQQVYAHLVARGATVDIWMASVTGDLARVRELLDADASLVNRLSDYHSYYAGCGSAIQNAASGGHIEIVTLLLERGADPNLPEPGIAPRGRALYSAVYCGHYDVARLLLERGAHPNVEVESSADTLSIAKMRGDQRMVELLCSYGAARSVDLLAHSNDLETAAAVFAANPALADNLDAVGGAASQGHDAFIRLMLRSRPDLAARVAFGSPRPAVTALLFAHGMNPNTPHWPGVSALHGFAGGGDIENAAISLAHGATIDAIDEEFCTTPLGQAARHGRTLMTAFLLRRGAALRPEDVPEWSLPIAWAVRRGHQRVVDILTNFERDGSLPPPPTPEQLESLATDLVAAFNTGDAEALGRLKDYFSAPRIELTHLRREARARLGLGKEQQEITIEQARELVWRMHGAPYVDERSG